MWKIGKEFEFCYGHRVWTQKLKEGFSTDMCSACRRIHGHNGKVIVYLESQELTDGMITDFKHLGWFKKWLDETLDHKFIMDTNDPLHKNLFLYSFHYNNKLDEISNSYVWNEGNIDLLEDGKGMLQVHPYLKELYEGLVLVNFIPTSENLSKWLCDIVNQKMNQIGIKCTQVQFFETPKSQSNFYL